MSYTPRACACEIALTAFCNRSCSVSSARPSIRNVDRQRQVRDGRVVSGLVPMAVMDLSTCRSWPVYRPTRRLRAVTQRTLRRNITCIGSREISVREVEANEVAPDVKLFVLTTQGPAVCIRA